MIFYIISNLSPTSTQRWQTCRIFVVRQVASLWWFSLQSSSPAFATGSQLMGARLAFLDGHEATMNQNQTRKKSICRPRNADGSGFLKSWTWIHKMHGIHGICAAHRNDFGFHRCFWLCSLAKLTLNMLNPDLRNPSMPQIDSIQTISNNYKIDIECQLCQLTFFCNRNDGHSLFMYVYIYIYIFNNPAKSWNGSCPFHYS